MTTYTSAQLLAESQRPIKTEVREEYLRHGSWRDRTMVDDILDRIAEHPKKASIITYREGTAEPQSITYGELGERIDRYASTFIDMGVERDDVVSIQLTNCWEFAALAIAAMRAGAVVNPLVTIFRHRELEFMLSRARSKVLIVPDSFRGCDHAAMAAELLDSVPTLERVIAVPREGTTIPQPVADFASVFDAPSSLTGSELTDELTRRRRGPEDPITIMYTSGTTGEPKGTVHTYNTMWSAARPLCTSLGSTGDDVAFMASTMGHLTGFLWGMMQPLALGMTDVFQEVWDADALVRFGDEHGITWTVSATPFVVDLMNAQRRAPSRGLTSFKYFVCGGGPIPSALPPEADEVLGAKLLALWGTSECGIITIHSTEDGPQEVSDNDGWQVPPMELRILGDDDQPVQPGTPGRLVVRGPSLFRGYLHRMDLYDAVVDDDGWFDTGDLGVEKPTGGIRITGRAKDIILRGGENIPVVEVENALYQHPKIRDVVVVAYPDERLGERGCAVVVPDGDAPTLEELTAFLDGQRMAKQYWPEMLDIRDEMPRTPSGKIQKFVLRQQLRDEVLGSASKTSG